MAAIDISPVTSDISFSISAADKVAELIKEEDNFNLNLRVSITGGGAPMPYCMFFSKNYAIHGSYELPHYNASHGCVRVSPSDANWLSHHFVRIGTKVVIRPY